MITAHPHPSSPCDNSALPLPESPGPYDAGILAPPPPVTPVVTGLTPSTMPVGGPDAALVVNGASFQRASVVWWDGAAAITTYVNSTTLRIMIKPSLELNARLVPVTVKTDTLAAAATLQFSYTKN